MTRHVDDITKELEALADSGDAEIAHSRADELILEYLEAIGHDDIVATWRRVCDKVGFWYA